MNISDYIKRKKNLGASDSQTNAPSDNGGDNNINKDNMSPKNIQDAVSSYSQLGEEQLMQEMFKAANEGRKSGELTDEKLDGFYEQSKSFLTPEQAERMKALIIELKK